MPPPMTAVPISRGNDVMAGPTPHQVADRHRLCRRARREERMLVQRPPLACAEHRGEQRRAVAALAAPMPRRVRRFTSPMPGWSSASAASMAPSVTSSQRQTIVSESRQLGLQRGAANSCHKRRLECAVARQPGARFGDRADVRRPTAHARGLRRQRPRRSALPPRPRARRRGRSNRRRRTRRPRWSGSPRRAAWPDGRAPHRSRARQPSASSSSFDGMKP